MKPCAAVVPWRRRRRSTSWSRSSAAAPARRSALFDLHDVQAAFTRPVFVNHLTQNWLPALPDVQAKLTAGEPVRIAEVGCGEGLAAHHDRQAPTRTPRSTATTSTRRRSPSPSEAAADAGVADRVRFEVRDAADPDASTATTTSSWRSRCSTTCPTRSASCARCSSSPATPARSSSSTSAAEDVVHRARRTRWSASSTRSARCTASPSACRTAAPARARSSAPTRCAATPTDAGFSTVDVLDVEHPQFRLYQLA